MTSPAEGPSHKACGFATAESFAATFSSAIELMFIVETKTTTVPMFSDNMNDKQMKQAGLYQARALPPSTGAHNIPAKAKA